MGKFVYTINLMNLSAFLCKILFAVFPLHSESYAPAIWVSVVWNTHWYADNADCRWYSKNGKVKIS